MLAIDMVIVLDILRYRLWADRVLCKLQMYNDSLQLNQNSLCQMDSETSFPCYKSKAEPKAARLWPCLCDRALLC
jgi:hypothetical protein